MRNEFYKTDPRWIPQGSLGTFDGAEWFCYKLNQPKHEYRNALVYNVVAHEPELDRDRAYWLLWSGDRFVHNQDRDMIALHRPELLFAATECLNELEILRFVA
jgi:hypothetical protein